jgi:Predicted transcriptional regulators
MACMTDTAVRIDDEPTGADALTLGRRVRAFRLERAMTLEALATAIDRAPSQVSAIENGNREPRSPSCAPSPPPSA